MSLPTLTKSEIILLRLKNNGLLSKFETPLECVESLIGMQAQIQVFAEVSIFNRTQSVITFDDLDVLYKNHQIGKRWGQRGTVHIYTIEDWKLISYIYFYKNKHKELLESKNPEEFKSLIDAIADIGKTKGIVSKSDITKIIEKNGKSFLDDEYFKAFIFSYCTLSSLFIGYPKKPHTKEYIHHSELDVDLPVHNDKLQKEAIKTIMLKYFKSYAPATHMDFCHWSGLTKTSTLALLEDIKDSLDCYTSNNLTYYVHKDVDTNLENLPTDQIFLLGKFDPLFVSYKHKDWIVNTFEEKQIWLSSARVEAVLLIGTKVYGTWRYEVKGKKISFVYSLFQKINKNQMKIIESKSKELSIFLEKEFFDLKFIEQTK